MTQENYSLSDFEPYRGMFGCYAFYEASTCLYVGKATCIFSRIKGHKLRFRGHDRFSAWNLGRHVEGMDYKNAHAFLHLMEAYLIFKLNPFENQTRPDFAALFLDASETLPACRAVERLTGCFPAIMPCKP